MPAIHRGATPVTAIYRGAVPVTAVYRGNVLVWSLSSMYEGFNRADAPDIDPTGTVWIDDGGGGTYTAGIVGNACRLAIPDNIIGWGFTTIRRRYAAATAAGDDGHIEMRAASIGNDGFTTQVFRRVGNAASTHGVGIDLNGSNVRITRRVGGTDTVMRECGSFGAGDVLRLEQVGNLHTMLRNGEFAGEWNDTGATAAKGSGFRSMMLRVDGIKDPFGARRFSASIDYIECS